MLFGKYVCMCVLPKDHFTFSSISGGQPFHFQPFDHCKSCKIQTEIEKKKEPFNLNHFSFYFQSALFFSGRSLTLSNRFLEIR